MRQQHIKREEPKPRPTVINTQSPKRQPSDRPVRTVLYVEVGGMDQARVAVLASQFAAQYEGSAVGTHYVVPVRNGRIGTDLQFEAEFLDTVRQLCEVRDGEIALKDGATQVRVLRQHIMGEPE